MGGRRPAFAPSRWTPTGRPQVHDRTAHRPLRFFEEHEPTPEVVDVTERAAPRVLVVDDDRAVRDSLRRALGLHGFEVALAPDGLSALQAVTSAAPDVLVLDVTMPGVDGLAVVRRLRQDGHDLPVLMLTARDAVPDRVAGLATGADDYLVKPFAYEELLARLRAMERPRVNGVRCNGTMQPVPAGAGTGWIGSYNAILWSHPTDGALTWGCRHCGPPRS
jgi:CheY-like chemotaxis protein